MTSDENIIDRLAAPDSLLGMLQRGRGAGYLAALDAPRETVWPLLLECITNDPRLDQQCEDRAEYYASLILATGMDLKPIYSLVKQTDHQENASGPPLGTLVALAERGSEEAVQMLRDYISFGLDAHYVILVLWDLKEPAALDGIDEVVYQCIISDPEEYAQFKRRVEDDWRRYRDLDAEDRSRYRLMLPVCEPWKTLCQRNKGLMGLFEDVGIAYDQPPPPRQRLTDDDLAGLSLHDLFDSVNESNWRPFWRVLPGKVFPEDEDFLLQNVCSDNKYRVILAFRGLGELGTPKAFEAAKAYMEAAENADRRVRHKVFDAIEEMPSGSCQLLLG